MTEPTPTAPPVLTQATKAWVAAVLSTLASVLFVAAPFLPENLRPAAYAVAGILGVVGVPFGVYITVNPAVKQKV